MGHRSAPRGMFTGSPAECMQIRPEQEVVPLAEVDAQSPQRTLDPRTLTDTPAIGGKALKKVEERVCGGALPAIRLDHEGREVVAAGLAQGVDIYLVQLPRCTNLGPAPCGPFSRNTDVVGKGSVFFTFWCSMFF